MNNTIQITDEIVWDNTKLLHEQSAEANKWYSDNINGKISTHVPLDIKKQTAERLGLAGEFPEEADDLDKFHPIDFDGFARPTKWKFELDGIKFNVEIEYIQESTSWARKCITVKIEKI